MPMFFRACRHHSTKSAKWGTFDTVCPLVCKWGQLPLCPPRLRCLCRWSAGMSTLHMNAGSPLCHWSIATSIMSWSRLHQTWISPVSLHQWSPRLYGKCVSECDSQPGRGMSYLESKIKWNKVRLLPTQQFNSFTSTMCRCTVLLQRI